MKFGKTDTQNANGSILAHSLRVSDGRIRKGTLLNSGHITQLINAGINDVTVARLEAGDVHEDEAAELLAKALIGHGIKLGQASTGRVNCYAQNAGLLSLPRKRLLALNQVSESITAATLAENRWVEAGKMVATIKIIPYAVTEQSLLEAISAGSIAHLDEALNSGDENSQSAQVCVFSPIPRQASLVQTTLENTSVNLLEKTHKTTQRRLNIRNVNLIGDTHCAHDIDELSHQLKVLSAQKAASPDDKQGSDKRSNPWILISGASAISDRRDVIPQALEKAGGTVIRCGIPVDPGNLLMLGQLGNHTVIGIPGCARSPKHNGLDLFMDRLACNLPVNEDWINSLAIGGLMDEIIDRPQPRIKTTMNENVTAILLAGGSSRRFGEDNKLLALKDDQTLIHHALQNIVASQINRLIIVLGYDAQTIERHCHDFFSASHQRKNLEIDFVLNAEFDSGMASSLRAGVSHLLNRSLHSDSSHTHAAMVFLADMPSVNPTTINTLIGTLESEAIKQTADLNCKKTSAIVPTYNTQRGNPVILMPELFDLLLDVTGDVGARQLLRANPEVVLEVKVDDNGILADYDTPDQLQN